MEIAMIRHYPTKGNINKRYIGCTDEPVYRDRGLMERAEELKRRLKGWGMPGQVSASPMKRCVETAQLLFPGKQLFLCEEMRECDFGLFEGKNYRELSSLPAYQQWVDSGGKLPFPEGEGTEEFKVRCVRGFEKEVERLALTGSERAAMVVHGGTIMSVLSNFDCQKRGFYEWQVENGGGFLLSLDDGEWEDGNKTFREIERL